MFRLFRVLFSANHIIPMIAQASICKKTGAYFYKSKEDKAYISWKLNPRPTIGSSSVENAVLDLQNVPTR